MATATAPAAPLPDSDGLFTRDTIAPATPRTLEEERRERWERLFCFGMHWSQLYVQMPLPPGWRPTTDITE